MTILEIFLVVDFPSGDWSVGGLCWKRGLVGAPPRACIEPCQGKASQGAASLAGCHPISAHLLRALGFVSAPGTRIWPSSQPLQRRPLRPSLPGPQQPTQHPFTLRLQSSACTLTSSKPYLRNFLSSILLSLPPPPVHTTHFFIKLPLCVPLSQFFLSLFFLLVFIYNI